MQYDATQYEPQTGGFEAIPDGDYSFLVTNAIAAISKNGNEMIELTLEVDVGHDSSIRCYDWLVAVKAALWKVHSFCEAVGLDFHADESLPEQCLGRRGLAHFTLGEPNDKGRQCLKVERYLESQAISTDASASPAADKPDTQAVAGNSTDLFDVPF